MCQQIVFGTDYSTRKFDLGSGAEFLCKKSLFYGPVESYFAAYDSVVLTGPTLRNISSTRLPASVANCPRRWTICVVASGRRLNPNHPSPCCTTRRNAGSVLPPKIIGGWGCCTGLGLDITGGNWQNSPRYAGASCVHTAFMASRYSHVRWARRSGGTPRARHSSCNQPMPTPKSKRPLESRSRLATILAVIRG